jgi:hypothetical protein
MNAAVYVRSGTEKQRSALSAAELQKVREHWHCSLSVEAFRRAVLNDSTNRLHRNRFAGYFASLLRRYR